MDQNTQNHNQSLPGVIYVGRTEGELATVLGKVGRVENPELLEKRALSYRVADRIFHFEMEAAFAVELPPKVSIDDVETMVHFHLQGMGLAKYGENFPAPDGSMTLLARLVEQALARLGYRFTALDVDAMQARARELNSHTWQKLRKGKQERSACPYNAWLEKQCQPPQGMVALARPRNHVRNVLALGYLIRDLAVGTDLECIQVPLYRGGNLKIYPTSLEAALFEAQAEADLSLVATTSFSACPTTLEQIPAEPYAMTLLLGSNLEQMEIQNTFLPPTKDKPDEVRISPEHLAALGLLGGRYDEFCLYEGLGVRASLPLDLYPTILQYPEDLPGIRFWLGLKHCSEQGLRIQDFTLPLCVGSMWERVAKAAGVLAMAGCPVPKKAQEWVANRWIPSRG